MDTPRTSIPKTSDVIAARRVRAVFVSMEQGLVAEQKTSNTETPQTLHRKIGFSALQLIKRIWDEAGPQPHRDYSRHYRNEGREC